MIERNGADLRATARRFSYCADDADDAFQRAFEILLLKAPTTDTEVLTRWMQTVTKREALAVRRARRQILSLEMEEDEDEEPCEVVELSASRVTGPHEWAMRRENVARSGEALNALKPDELRSLVLLAEGYTYDEIGRLTGWTQTKVNRCLAEGRRRYLETYANIEAGRRCEELAGELSAYCDGELDRRAALRVRRHLVACGYCRATVREYRGAPEHVLALLPMALPAALPAGRPALQRLHEWVAGAHLKVFGAGDVAGPSQLAASGGGKGTGLALAAKVFAVCAGTAGAGAACVATGVVPEPVRDRLPLIREHTPQAAPPAPVAAEPAPEPPAEPDRVDIGGGANAATDPAPAPEPLQQEFAPQGSPAPAGSASVGGSGGGGSGSGGGGGGKVPLTGGSGEFGP